MIQNPIPWPNGARCACVVSFDMDADSLIHIARPDDAHDRLYPISMGRYGPNVAIPRILETYRRLGIQQSFFFRAGALKHIRKLSRRSLKVVMKLAITGICMKIRSRRLIRGTGSSVRSPLTKNTAVASRRDTVLRCTISTRRSLICWSNTGFGMNPR